jgi:hypothetical protein
MSEATGHWRRVEPAEEIQTGDQCAFATLDLNDEDNWTPAQSSIGMLPKNHPRMVWRRWENKPV